MGATRWIADHSAIVAQALTPWVLLLERQAFDMELEAPKMHRVLPSPSELTPEIATRLRPKGCHDAAAERASREWADNTEA